MLGELRSDRAWRRFLNTGRLVSIVGMLRRGQLALHLREAEQRAEEAERTRDEVALRKAVEERLRIARELHDSLTHSISVIHVQAGVAAHLARKRGEEVPAALAAIQEASADASRELRATLGVLRASRQLRLQRASPAGRPHRAGAGGGAAGRGDGRRDRAAGRRRGPGGVPDRAGSAHQRHQARGPGLYDGAPEVRARPANRAGRRRRSRERRLGRRRCPHPAADIGDGPDRDARAGIRARRQP